MTMAMIKNNVTLAGYATNVNFSVTSKGTPRLRFRLEMPFEEGDQGQFTGVRKINAVVWGTLAEEFSGLEDNVNVEVEGPIDTRNWKTNETWHNETSVNVRGMTVLE